MGRRVLTTIPNPTTGRSDYTHLIDMSGSVESLKYQTDSDIGIADSWTIWTSRYMRTVTATLGLAQFKNATNNNDNIVITVITGGFKVQTYDSTGTILKDYSYNYSMEAERQWTIAVSWDGTSLVAALNGRVVAATTVTTDNSGSQTNSSRGVSTGLRTSNNDPNSVWHGLALWNEALSADEMAYITHPNRVMTDWKVDIETYTSSSNLVHQWRPVEARGLQSGTTYVADDIPGVGIDISTDASNMSDADKTTALADLPYISTNVHSIDFNGVDEYIQTPSAVGHGIGSVYSIKFTAKSLRDDTNETLFHIAPSGANTNAIKVEKQGATANDPMVIYIYSSAAVLLKEYHFYNALPSNTWKTYTFVWEQTGDTLTVYNASGAVVSANATPTNGAGSTTATSRHIAIGSDVDGGNYFYGRIREIAIFLNQHTAAVVGDMAPINYNLFKLGSGYTGSYMAGLERWILLGVPVPSAYRTTSGTAYIFDNGNTSADTDFSGGSGVGVSNINLTDSPFV